MLVIFLTLVMLQHCLLSRHQQLRQSSKTANMFLFDGGVLKVAYVEFEGPREEH